MNNKQLMDDLDILKQLARQYVENAKKKGKELDLTDFIQEWCNRELTAEEELMVIDWFHTYASEWKRIEEKERESA